MIRKILFLSFAILWILCCAPTVSATHEETLLGDSVYVTEEEKNSFLCVLEDENQCEGLLLNDLEQSYDIVFVKNSIQPIFTVKKRSNPDGKHYYLTRKNVVKGENRFSAYLMIAKTKDGRFAGVLNFYFDEAGKAHFYRFLPTNELKEEKIGVEILNPYFQDHQERIQKLLERREPISEKTARYVEISGYSMFYINDGAFNGFVMIENKYTGSQTEQGKELFSLDRDMKLLDEYIREDTSENRYTQISPLDQIVFENAGVGGRKSTAENPPDLEGSHEILSEAKKAVPEVVSAAKATPWQAWIGVGAAAALALAAGIVLARRKKEE